MFPHGIPVFTLYKAPRLRRGTNKTGRLIPCRFSSIMFFPFDFKLLHIYFSVKLP